MKSTNSVECVLARQAAGYGFLASVFLDLPDTSLVERIREMATKVPGKNVNDKATALMLCYASRVAAHDDESIVVELGIDRAKLVRHVDGRCIKPPYESLWTSESENDTLSHLNRFFLTAGYAPSKNAHEPADFIGMELSFLGFLCEEELRARKEGRSEEAEKIRADREAFFGEHFGAWVPRYAAEMEQAAATDFYKAIAILLGGVVRPGKQGGIANGFPM